MDNIRAVLLKRTYDHRVVLRADSRDPIFTCVGTKLVKALPDQNDEKPSWEYIGMYRRRNRMHRVESS